MRIGTPDLDVERGHLVWSVAVDGPARAPDRLWFRLPEAHADLATELADPAVIGLILPAMRADERLEVEGPVTDELVHNLTHGYQHILEATIPGVRRVALDAPNAVPAGAPAPGVGTGFSAGVDSYAVLAEHHFSPVPDALRLTHLTFFNVGSHNRGEQGRRLFHDRYELLAPVAARMGLPFVPVDSNLDDFYDFGDYQLTYGPRNIGAASLLQGGLGRYYFAGSFSYAHTGVHPSHDTAFSDPISMPLLITGQFRPSSHGNQYTRVDKTLLIADVPATHTSLNVCVAPLRDGRNCSRCAKCLRTQLTLEIAGRLDEYRSVFDLDIYRTARAAFLARVAIEDDEFAAEIRDYARSEGFHLPSAGMAHVRHGVHRAKRKARTLARLLRNRKRSGG